MRRSCEIISMAMTGLELVPNGTISSIFNSNFFSWSPSVVGKLKATNSVRPNSWPSGRYNNRQSTNMLTPVLQTFSEDRPILVTTNNENATATGKPVALPRTNPPQPALRTKKSLTSGTSDMPTVLPRAQRFARLIPKSDFIMNDLRNLLSKDDKEALNNVFTKENSLPPNELEAAEKKVMNLQSEVRDKMEEFRTALGDITESQFRDFAKEILGISKWPLWDELYAVNTELNILSWSQIENQPVTVSPRFFHPRTKPPSSMTEKTPPEEFFFYLKGDHKPITLLPDGKDLVMRFKGKDAMVRAYSMKCMLNLVNPSNSDERELNSAQRNTLTEYFMQVSKHLLLSLYDKTGNLQGVSRYMQLPSNCVGLLYGPRLQVALEPEKYVKPILEILAREFLCPKSEIIKTILQSSSSECDLKLFCSYQSLISANKKKFASYFAKLPVLERCEFCKGKVSIDQINEAVTGTVNGAFVSTPAESANVFADPDTICAFNLPLYYFTKVETIPKIKEIKFKNDCKTATVEDYPTKVHVKYTVQGVEGIWINGKPINCLHQIDEQLWLKRIFASIMQHHLKKYFDAKKVSSGTPTCRHLDESAQRLLLALFVNGTTDMSDFIKLNKNV